jgi:hypothetical protein
MPRFWKSFGETLAIRKDFPSSIIPNWSSCRIRIISRQPSSANDIAEAITTKKPRRKYEERKHRKEFFKQERGDRIFDLFVDSGGRVCGLQSNLRDM